jgi:hypothetical protein
VRRFRQRVLTVVAIIGVAACQSSTAPCESAGELAGDWSYAATQVMPMPTIREGIMKVDAQACPDLRGSLDVMETDASGRQRRLAGPLYGVRAGGAKSVRLDITLGGVVIEHAATLRGDSLVGEWFVTGRDGVAARGTFGARRAGGVR